MSRNNRTLVLSFDWRRFNHFQLIQFAKLLKSKLKVPKFSIKSHGWSGTHVIFLLKIRVVQCK